MTYYMGLQLTSY